MKRENILLPIYKNKGGIEYCNNYHKIIFMSHTMMLWKGIIEKQV